MGQGARASGSREWAAQPLLTHPETPPPLPAWDAGSGHSQPPTPATPAGLCPPVSFLTSVPPSHPPWPSDQPVGSPGWTRELLEGAGQAGTGYTGPRGWRRGLSSAVPPSTLPPPAVGTCRAGLPRPAWWSLGAAARPESHRPAAVPLKPRPGPAPCGPGPAFREPQPQPQERRCARGPHLHSSVPASSSSWGDRQAPAARSSPMTLRRLP